MRGYKHTVSLGFSAINAKTLAVEFNQAVAEEDQAAATFAVKRGSVNVTVTATWVEDGKSVELASGANLLVGDYTVKIEGLTEEALEGEVTIKAITPTALEVKSKVLNDESAQAKVDVALTDQYGENIALASADFTATALNVTQSKSYAVLFDAAEKYFYIATNTSADDFKADDVVRVTFLHNKSGLQTTADLTVVAGAYLDTITLGEIELPKGKDLLTADLKNVKISYVAKDQFDNEITLVKGTNVEVISSDEAILKAANVTVNKVEEKITKLEISKLEKAGKVTLTLMSKASGKTASVLLDIQETPGKISNVEVLDPEVTVAAGGTAYVGLEVSDNYGKEIEAKDYISAFTIVSSNPAVVANTTPIALETTAGDNYGKVKVDVVAGATKGATTTLTITDTTSGKEYASFTVTAGETAAPTTIELKATSKHKTTLAKGATTTIDFEAKDQYGNKLSSADASYSVVFAVKDKADAIDLTGQDVDKKKTETDETNASATINATKVGTAKLVVQLVKGTEVLDSKEFDFTVVANDSTVGLQIKDIPVLYQGNSADYAEEVVVETADGIALPSASIISVTSSDTSVVTVAAGNKLQGQSVTEDTKATITVVYNADDKVVTLEKEVTVSAATLKAEEIKVVDTQQDTGTSIVQKLVANTKDVTTIDVADFTTLSTYAKAFAVVEDNFGRLVNAKTAGTDHNIVTVTIANEEGFTDASSDDAITIAADGQLQFTAFSDNLINSEDGKASFRIIITAGGKAATVQVNVAGGLTVDEDAVDKAKTALTTLAFDASQGKGHATPIIDKPADAAGITYTLAVGNFATNDDGGTAKVNDDGNVEITRDGTAQFTFDITVTIRKGSAEDTKVFTITVPTATGDVTIS